MRKIKELLKNKMQSASKNQKGFSLVELIIVIAILGIIAAIALPNVTKSLRNSKKQADITNAKAIANAVAILEAEGTNGSKITIADTATYQVLTDEIKKELNGNEPKPALVSGNKFYVKIEKTTGAITVGAGTAADNVVAIYPVPATDGEWAK